MWGKSRTVVEARPAAYLEPEDFYEDGVPMVWEKSQTALRDIRPGKPEEIRQGAHDALTSANPGQVWRGDR